MQKLLVPVLVLAIVALSSSNVLPVTINELKPDPLGFNYQDNDNTYSSKHQNRNKLNAIFNADVDPDTETIPQSEHSYVDSDEEFNSKNENYNVKGFRKEQWHNYPRQLDRLNRYFYQHQSADKRNLDPDDPGSDYDNELDEKNQNNDITKEYNPAYTQPHTNNEAELAAAVINPLLILRIHLAYYNNNKAAIQPIIESISTDNEKLEDSYKEGNSFSNKFNPESNQIKVKREGKINSDDVDTAHVPIENRTVNKRIFALFSRLQSLNPKGHQLHHRRHMYALYGPPDGEGGGMLTAETRATFMRPPGSPLRWG